MSNDNRSSSLRNGLGEFAPKLVDLTDDVLFGEEHKILNNGVKLPRLGVGVYQLTDARISYLIVDNEVVPARVANGERE